MHEKLRFYKQTQTLISDFFPKIESPTTLGHEMTMIGYSLCLDWAWLSSSLTSPYCFTTLGLTIQWPTHHTCPISYLTVKKKLKYFCTSMCIVFVYLSNINDLPAPGTICI